MWTALSFVIAGGAYLVSLIWILPTCSSESACATEPIYRVSSDLSMFAGLFILALAVERVLEPFSRYLGSANAKDGRDAAVAEATITSAETSATGTDAEKQAREQEESAQKLAEAQAEVDQHRQTGATLHWGVAVAIAFLLASSLNVLFLTAVSESGSAPPERWIDLLVTGLVIGAGTKPLHDLISRIEKTKQESEDASTTATAP